MSVSYGFVAKGAGISFYLREFHDVGRPEREMARAG